MNANSSFSRSSSSSSSCVLNAPPPPFTGGFDLDVAPNELYEDAGLKAPPEVDEGLALRFTKL